MRPAAEPADEPGNDGAGAPRRARAARQALHVTVGLAVLGVQQFQADRPGIEQDLRAMRLPALAAVTNRAGGFVDSQVARLLGLPRPSR